MAKKTVASENVTVSRGKAKLAMPVNSFDEKMAALAKRQQKAESKSLGGNFISLKGGHFSIGGNVIKGDKIRVTVLDSIALNVWYSKPWNAASVEPPDCYAFGVSDEDGEMPDMAPHKDAMNPQSTYCTGCPMNEFGTSNTGKGKACNNQRRLALILEDDLGDTAATIWMLNVSVTSVKAWASYVDQVTNAEDLPTAGMVTEVSIFTLPGKTYSGLSFAFERPLNNDELGNVLSRLEEAARLLVVPFAAPKEKEEAPVKGKKKPVAASTAPAAKRKFSR